MTREQILATALFVSAGFWYWLAHFTLVYGFTALACARGIATPSTVRLVVAAATVAVLAVLLVHLASALRPRRGETSSFLHDIAALGALLGIVGTIWTALPASVVVVCA